MTRRLMDLEQARALRDRVTHLFAKSDFERGTKLLQEVEKELPPHVRLECWGNLYFYKRDLQRAKESYESAIRLEPEYIVARYQYVAALHAARRGDLVEAFEA